MFPARTTVVATLGSLVLLLASVSGSGVAEVAAQSSPTRSQVSKAVLGARDYARTVDDVFGGVWITDDGAVFAFTYFAISWRSEYWPVRSFWLRDTRRTLPFSRKATAR